jgi:hypothetical protein
VVILEIDELDKAWATIAGIDLEVIRIYSGIVYLLDNLVIATDVSEIRAINGMLDAADNNLRILINTDFANDDSSKKLKEKAIEMLDDLRNKRAKIGK